MNDFSVNDKLENIEKSMNDLKKSMDILNELVSDQQTEYDTIEHFMEISKKETIEGSTNIIDAKEKYSYISYIGLSLITMFLLNK
jgi:t-SNARE complex subunit (syntaxin)